MATEYFAFIQPLRDAPDDETLRLAYTDWLEERNDPRAEYLRTEAAWVALRPGAEPYRPLYRELSRLAAVQDPTWVTWVGRMAHLARRAWGPVSSGFEPWGSSDPPREWGAALSQLPGLADPPVLQKYFRRPFCVPVDFAAFLCAVGGQSDGWEFYTGGSGFAASYASLLRQNQNASLSLTERWDFWIEFGGWGEQHRHFVCCDFDSPQFGVVAEGADSNAWMRGPDGLSYRGRHLLHFLTDYQPISYRDDVQSAWPHVPFEEWGIS
ncbi:MAG TPA: TIGR02996 domain-containing protein [Gemmata sp.]